MIDFHVHVGDQVVHADRLYAVRGVSPMSAVPRRVLLEDLETGALVEVNAVDVQPVSPPDEPTTAEFA